MNIIKDRVSQYFNIFVGITRSIILGADVSVAQPVHAGRTASLARDVRA